MRQTRVVTSFLKYKGRVLLVKRSAYVKHYRGLWAAISGHVERKPIEQAYVELAEETGLGTQDVKLLRKASPLFVPDRKRNRLWIIYPFLFEVL